MRMWGLAGDQIGLAFVGDPAQQSKFTSQAYAFRQLRATANRFKNRVGGTTP
jgi:hypothetical protein